MARQVFILGTGASASAGPPVMANFIDVAERLMQEEPQGLQVEAFQEFFGTVIPRLRQLQINSRVKLGNIEQVCGLLEMADLVERLPLATTDEARALLRNLKIVLAETVQYTCRFSMKENRVMPTADYARLVALPLPPQFKRDRRGGRAFITFNYDLALDHALADAHQPVDYCLDETRPANATPLLKLHGSLNWARCPGCLKIVPLSIMQLYETPGSFEMVDSGVHVVACPDRAFTAVPNCTCPKSSGWERGIVPPSWNKGQHYGPLRRAWRTAAQEISEADQIFIIGYSLPTSDLFFRDLFAISLAGAERVKQITVVNRDGQISETIRALLADELGGRVRSFAMSFDEWLRNSATASINQ